MKTSRKGTKARKAFANGVGILTPMGRREALERKGLVVQVTRCPVCGARQTLVKRKVKG